MTVIPPGFAEVTFKGRPAIGYREFNTSVGFVVASLSQEDVALIDDQWTSIPGALGAPTTAVTTGVLVKVGTSDPSAPITFESSLSGAGSGSAALMPPNVAYLISKTSNLGGRKGRGRNFLPWVREDKVDNVGQVDGTFLDSVQETWENLMSDVAGFIGGDAVILHSDATPPSTVTGFNFQSVVSTQRRRLVRGS